MVWHIKKTSILGGSRTIYYKGNNSWTDNYADRITYSSEKNIYSDCDTNLIIYTCCIV